MGKRIQGYAIRINAFVPVDPNSLEDQRKCLEAVEAAVEKGDLSKLVAKLEYVDVQQKFTSKNIETPPAQGASNKSDAAGDPESNVTPDETAEPTESEKGGNPLEEDPPHDPETGELYEGDQAVA